MAISFQYLNVVDRVVNYAEMYTVEIDGVSYSATIQSDAQVVIEGTKLNKALFDLIDTNFLTIAQQWDTKANAVFDSTPVASSGNLITSGTAYNMKEDAFYTTGSSATQLNDYPWFKDRSQHIIEVVCTGGSSPALIDLNGNVKSMKGAGYTVRGQLIRDTTYVAFYAFIDGEEVQIRQFVNGYANGVRPLIFIDLGIVPTQFGSVQINTTELAKKFNVSQ